MIVQRVTRPRGGINEWLHWLPLSLHRKVMPLPAERTGTRTCIVLVLHAALQCEFCQQVISTVLYFMWGPLRFHS